VIPHASFLKKLSITVYQSDALIEFACPSLEELSIINNRNTVVRLSGLSQCSRLSKLSLPSYFDLGTDGLKDLSALTSLNVKMSYSGAVCPSLGPH